MSEWISPCEKLDRDKVILKTLTIEDMKRINEHFRNETEKRRRKYSLINDVTLYYK